MSRVKKIDLLILLIYPVLGTALSFLLKINAFASVLIFFALPALYLTLKMPRFALRAGVFSLLVSFPFIIIIDYIAHLTNQWIIPNSILPRIFEYVTIEVIIWAFFNFYFVILFYEYFIHDHFTKIILYPKLKYLFLFSLFLFLTFLGFYNFDPNLLSIEYFYFRYGIVVIFIPIILQLIKYPRFIIKFIKTGAYFFYVTLLYEITALKLGWWVFPSTNFIGWVSILGERFPIEEFIFWLLLFAMAVLSFYEYFDAEEK